MIWYVAIAASKKFKSLLFKTFIGKLQNFTSEIEEKAQDLEFVLNFQDSRMIKRGW